MRAAHRYVFPSRRTQRYTNIKISRDKDGNSLIYIAASFPSEIKEDTLIGGGEAARRGTVELLYPAA